MGEALRTQALLRLMAWMSPAFPIGGFAYSGGLERAVHDRLVEDAAGLECWLVTILRHGNVWNDAMLFAEAWRQHENEAALAELSEFALALAGSGQRYLETLSLGRAFIAAARAWPGEVFDRLPCDIPFPVAVGAVAAAHAVPVRDALAAHLHAALSQYISAGIRLGACGQVDGVAMLAALEHDILAVADRAASGALDDIGTSCIQAEVVSLRHETQHSRLFRS
ncbi:MAG TPA: urease accessory UreF family protein [Pseudorhizobium sp.]|nr:urease accessory UreF family protein [Pseudorhizobium sp.]